MTTRSIGRLLAAPLNPLHWQGLRRAPSVYRDLWGAYLYRYLAGRGSYPYRPTVKTPTGDVRPTVYGLHDLFTIQEIFGWRCYEAPQNVRTFVDFGGNIGISALYFLTRNSHVRGYVYEPLHKNYTKAEQNLQLLAERVEISQVAIMDFSGQETFTVEDTGRYSGYGLPFPGKEVVRCREVNDVLSDIIAREATIDILKIDIEGAEKRIIPCIREEHLRRIKMIYIEADHVNLDNLLKHGFTSQPHIRGVHRLANARLLASDTSAPY